MFNGPLYRLFKIISSVSRGHIRFTDRFIRHISFQIEITRTAKNSGRSSTFRCLLSSEAFGLSRQTGFRKFPTEVSATKHAHAAHAHVHHHCAAQLLHGCFLPFLEILRHFVDVGIVAPYCIFVKRFFHFLSFFTKCFFSAPPILCIFRGERTLLRIRILPVPGVESDGKTGTAGDRWSPLRAWSEHEIRFVGNFSCPFRILRFFPHPPVGIPQNQLSALGQTAPASADAGALSFIISRSHRAGERSDGLS